MYPLFLATHNPAERRRCAGRLNLNSSVPGFASHKHQDTVMYYLFVCWEGVGGWGSINPFTVSGFASHKHQDAVRGAGRSAIHVVIHRHVLLCIISVSVGRGGGRVLTPSLSQALRQTNTRTPSEALSGPRFT